MLIRGFSRSEPTAQLSRELDLSYRQTLTLRHRLQQNVADSAPSTMMEGTEFEADELYHNAGEKKYAASEQARPATAASQ